MMISTSPAICIKPSDFRSAQVTRHVGGIDRFLLPRLEVLDFGCRRAIVGPLELHRPCGLEFLCAFELFVGLRCGEGILDDQARIP